MRERWTYLKEKIYNVYKKTGHTVENCATMKEKGSQTFHPLHGVFPKVKNEEKSYQTESK